MSNLFQLNGILMTYAYMQYHSLFDAFHHGLSSHSHMQDYNNIAYCLLEVVGHVILISFP